MRDDNSLSALVWKNAQALLEQRGLGAGLGLDAVLRATRNNIGRGQLQRLSAGENVTLQTVERLANALGVAPSSLFAAAAPADIAHVCEQPAPYVVDSPAELIRAVDRLVQRTPANLRVPVADLLYAWARTAEDDGRKDALLNLLRTPH